MSYKFKENIQKTNQEQCRGCGSIKLIEDIREGSIYCQVCSLEHRSHMIDYRAEWQPVINKDFFRGQKYDLDHKLSKIFDRVEKLADKLKLTDQHILETAHQIIRKVLDKKLQKSTRLQTIQTASLLYAIHLSAGDTNLAMRKILKFKTITQKEISRCFKALKEELKNEKVLLMNHEHPIVTYSRNYSENLSLPVDWIELIIYISKIVQSYLIHEYLEENNVFKTIKNWDGRSRSTIAATIVFFITRLPRCPIKVNLNMISMSSGIQNETIETCYRDMLPSLILIMNEAPIEIVTPKELRFAFQADVEMKLNNEIKKLKESNF